MTKNVNISNIKNKNVDDLFPCLGPVSNLEDYVRKDWWNHLFNSYYLKTDGDVVNDEEITSREIDIYTKILNLESNKKILDLCCGHGRHSLELAKRGFNRVEGLDKSRFLIQEAKKTARNKNLSVKFREGDARILPYPPDSFDVVMILGNSFGYFDSIQDDLKVLKEVFRVLKPWGHILIDLTDGEYLKNNYQPRSWEWIDREHYVCRERSLSLDKQRLISREVISHVNDGVLVDQFYAERLYSEKKIQELLVNAGLSDVLFHGTLTPNSRRNQDLGMMEKRLIISALVKKQWTPIKKTIKSAEKKVVVIMGDPNKPDVLKPAHIFDDDDFYTIDQLKDALRSIKGYQFIYLTNHDSLISDLIKINGNIDYVLNLCDEGYYNTARNELHVPALLDILHIPYTGAGPQCLAFCYDKSLVRGIAKEMDIPVPEAIFIRPGDKAFDLPLYFPAIVKPNFGDSSFGITQRCVVYNGEELIDAINEIRGKFGYDQSIIVEQFLTGKDLTVGIIGNPPNQYRILPISEDDYSDLPPELPKICGYEAKWLPDSPYWNIKSIPAILPDKTREIIESCSLKLFERLECKDYARFDWRLDGEGNPKLLEVNPNPGWCWDGHLAKMAKYGGLTYQEMLKEILIATENSINDKLI
ncbi:MAG: methyltransferase domain-containing protein [Promethearchaeota archaeon]|nr:MAG: methyltransferase domain-containing protein [Candidatus Lokiarchaeota archaeon]